jgi:hypothetical protein
MSLASDFKEAARSAEAICDIVGQSGSTCVIFWLDDGSVCAAQKLPTNNGAAARLEFGATKPCLDDCGVDDFPGTTYQKGTELLQRIEDS